jgi:phage tail sheath gpL-like
LSSISTTIPNNWNLPLLYIATDGSQAGNLSENQPGLIIAQMLSTGTATINVPEPVGSAADAANLFGYGSMAHAMALSWFAINNTQELYVAPVAITAGVAATGSITVTSIPTQSGVDFYYIAGQLVQINAFPTDTLAGIASRLASAINLLGTLPVTAAIDATVAAKVNLTAKWVGETTNDIQISMNYLGRYGGQTSPIGYAATITPMSGGVGNPDLTEVIANIATTSFYHVVSPYVDTAALTDLDNEFGFSQTGRWGWERAQYGWVYSAIRADYADALAFGQQVNSPVITTMLIEPTMPSPVWCVAAAYGATGAYYLLDDPARPLQTLPLTGILPALKPDRFSKSELNILTNNGLAVQATNSSGVPAILRETMQYQYNAYGQSDTAFGLLTILSNNAELLNRLSSAITTKFPRSKLAPDGTKFGPGQAIVTPSSIKAELVNGMIQAIYDGLAANLADFTTNLIVQIDDQNPNRIVILYPPQLMNQLRQFQVLNQFRLQYQQAAS